MPSAAMPEFFRRWVVSMFLYRKPWNSFVHEVVCSWPPQMSDYIRGRNTTRERSEGKISIFALYMHLISPCTFVGFFLSLNWRSYIIYKLGISRTLPLSHFILHFQWKISENSTTSACELRWQLIHWKFPKVERNYLICQCNNLI